MVGNSASPTAARLAAPHQTKAMRTLSNIDSWSQEVVNKEILAYYNMSGMREYCIRISVVDDGMQGESMQYVCSVSDLSQATKHILDADGIELDIPPTTHYGYPTLGYALGVCEKHNKQANFIINGHY